MKTNVLSKWVGASALAVSLAILPSALPAAAQTTPGDATTPGSTVTTTTADDDGFDWGWLGLLGLIGLAGLKGSKRDTNDRYTERVTTAPPTSNPRY